MFKRSWRLAKASWQVLKQDRELMLFPILSFVGLLGLLAPAAGLMFGLKGVDSQEALQPVGYVVIGLYYFGAAFITVFFNAALIGSATVRLQGGDPTLGDGLRLAWSHKGRIAGWAALTGTVGIILRLVSNKAGFIGQIVIAIVGAAWSMITYFVVPVLLYEQVGVGEAVKRSAQIFKARWGEQFIGGATVSGAIFLLMLPLIAVAVGLGAVYPPLGVAVGILGFGLLVTAGAAMQGIFNAALYRFATTGAIEGGFSADDLNGAFRLKRR